MVLVMRDLGPRSPWGRFRGGGGALRRVAPTSCWRDGAPSSCDDSVPGAVAGAARRERQPSDRSPAARPAGGAADGRRPTARLPPYPGPSSGWPARSRKSTRVCVKATPPTSMRSSGKRCACGRRSRSAPRLLLVAGPDRRTHGSPPGIQVAACLWLAMRRDDRGLWPRPRSGPSVGWRDPPLEHAGPGSRRGRRAPLCRRAVRRNGDARGAAGAAAASRRGSAPSAPPPSAPGAVLLVVVPDRGGEVFVG